MGRSEKVTIQCYGGCGRSVTIRSSKVRKADYYLCHSRQDGLKCEQKLPRLQAGKVRKVVMHAAGPFWGYSDEWSDAETVTAIIRAQEILANGLTKMAIKKVSQCN